MGLQIIDGHKSTVAQTIMLSGDSNEHEHSIDVIKWCLNAFTVIKGLVVSGWTPIRRRLSFSSILENLVEMDLAWSTTSQTRRS